MPPLFVWWCLAWMTPVGVIECRNPPFLTERECWQAFDAAKDIGPRDYKITCQKRGEVGRQDRPNWLMRFHLGDRREVI